LIGFLRTVERAAVLTGAGISAESGIPTFRGAQTGLWAQYRPEDLATPLAFRRNPGLVWEWYAWRRELVKKAQPNPGHLSLVKLGTIFKEFTLITQNVDSLHQRAGSQQVIELHGNISRIKCADEGVVILDWEGLVGSPPHCPSCGGLLRPDIVWFGEMLPPHGLNQAIRAAENCQIFFSIGTSSTVEPAASLPYIALEHGAKIVEINPDRTKLTTSAHYSFQGNAGEILPAIYAALSAYDMLATGKENS
jgi:NAD-dependent deacetylase